MVDNTVVGEATKRSNVLFNSISLGGCVVFSATKSTGTDSVDLLVEFSSTVVAELTSTGDGPLNGSGMPSSDTTDLAETSVSLAGHASNTESLDDTLGSLTTGNTNSVDHLELIENLSDGNFTLELLEAPIDLLSDGATVHLDLEEVSLTLAEVKLRKLGAGEDTDDGAVLLYSLKVSLDGVLTLGILFVSLCVVGECLLLGVLPVLVEAALELIG